MRQEIIDLYDDFTHRSLDRRVFMARLAELAGGSAAAAAMLPLLQASRAAAAVVPADDPGLRIENAAIPAEGGSITGYLARPRDAAGQLGAVVVVHENRGLNPHIQDIARRVAKAGFIAIAPDFLSRQGGTPEDEDKAREMIGQLTMPAVDEDAATVLAWAKQQEGSNQRAGIIGFCWGGGVVGRVATELPDLDAGVVFYGRTPPVDRVTAIEAPLLLHYAGLDQRINADVPAFRKALDEAGVEYQAFIYEGANHAFNNDTAAARYDAAAAGLAWRRTIEFLAAKLA